MQFYAYELLSCKPFISPMQDSVLLHIASFLG